MFVNDVTLFRFIGLSLSLHVVYARAVPDLFYQRPTGISVVNNSNTEIANYNVANFNNGNQTVIRVLTQTQSTKASTVFFRVMQILVDPLRKILSVPKINSVMRNIATCVVNGAVELITFYFPAPLIPVIASAAGTMFPFEPVLMLSEKLPVTSYRRAFLSALNSFLGTFDKYKLDDNFEYDPYMTQRFHRRMMNYGETDKPMIFSNVNARAGDKMIK